MKLPPWFARYVRPDVDERVTAARYQGNARPAPGFGNKALPIARYLRDDDAQAEPEFRAPRGRRAAALALAGSTAVNASTPAAGPRKIVAAVPFDLSVAHTDYALRVPGNTLIYNDSTNGTDRIKVRFAGFLGDQSAPQITMRPGEEIGGESFAVLLITNAAIPAAVAELVIGNTEPGESIVYR